MPIDPDYLDAYANYANERLYQAEREYSDALVQAVFYRTFLLTSLQMWAEDRRRLQGAELRLRELLGATPAHPENDVNDTD